MPPDLVFVGFGGVILNHVVGALVHEVCPGMITCMTDPLVTTETMPSRVAQLRADVDALSARASEVVDDRNLIPGIIGDPLEHLALELVDQIAAVARCLRTAEEPARSAEHVAWSLSLPALRG